MSFPNTGSSASLDSLDDDFYHISDVIPVALPPRVAGDGLEDPSSYFV